MAAPASPGLRSPVAADGYNFAAAVTPSDATTFAPTDALFVGGAGNVAVRMSGDATNVTFTGVTAGTVLRVRVDRVLLTGTTALNITALWA